MASIRGATQGTATVGKSLAHDSAELHVTGRALYIDDMREPEGLLHVVPGYARTAARGRIRSCDLEADRRRSRASSR